MSVPVPFIARVPRVYRYLDALFVGQFFERGALRVSSFKNFSTHADEQRLDPKEGQVHLIHRTSANGGQTLHMETEWGHDAYVLSASLVPSKDLMGAFGASSALVVHNPVSFMQAVAAQIPNVRAMIHGPCSYQNRRAIEKDLGWIDFGTNEQTSDPKKLNSDAVLQAFSALGTEDVYFIKQQSFRSQVEYRFVWLVHGAASQFLDLLVPDARPYCYRWEDQGEWISF